VPRTSGQCASPLRKRKYNFMVSKIGLGLTLPQRLRRIDEIAQM